MPDSYFGNLIQAIFTLTTAGFLLANPLDFGASVIQKAIESHNAKAIDEVMNVTRSGKRRQRFSSSRTPASTAWRSRAHLGLKFTKWISGGENRKGAAFASATDAENSKDRSSKSFTVASIPKVRYDMPVVLGYIHEKYQMKNLSGNTLDNSSQKVQHGKGIAGSSKKGKRSYGQNREGKLSF
ncbi:hypothetical protein V6N12_019074 [Hibiscus sabdariffa]|uniref:Uncharacterized protein n=1 Tax=Hibiscus sabdariffa TaxID=183260 RepID=A0ABR2B9X7_9ROSI